MRRFGRSCGYVFTAAGIVILSALALPAVTIWFGLGLVLLISGLTLTRRHG